MNEWDEETKMQAITAEKEHRWKEASDLFLKLGHYYKDKNILNKAAEYFMRSAVAYERCEQWRQLGYIWVNCGSALEASPTGAVSDMYDFLEASKHYFPTLDFEVWDSFPLDEKIGRAYRNAGYHLEKAGSNQSAYAQYMKGAFAFEKAGKIDEASRTLYLALLSFIERNGELDDILFNKLEEINCQLVKMEKNKYLKRCQVYYRGLAAKLASKGNKDISNNLFAKESECTRNLAKENRNYLRWTGYTLWKYSCGYGNNFNRWAVWALFLFIILFPSTFRYLGGLIWQEKARNANWLDYIYFSLSAITTGSNTSFIITDMGKLLISLEIVVSLIMLGALVSLFGQKLFR